MSHIIRPLARPRNLLYAGMVAGSILVGAGSARLGRLNSEFAGTNRPLAESVLKRAQMRQYLPSELAREEAKIRAMDVKLGTVPAFPEHGRFPLPIERRTETDSAEKRVMEAIEFLKQVPISGGAGRTWHDFFRSNARRMVFEAKGEDGNIMVADPKSGAITIYAENLAADLRASKEPVIYAASSLVHEGGHIAAGKSGQNGKGRNLASKILFSAADFFGIKTDSLLRRAFENGGQRTQDERNANSVELRFLDDVKNSGKYGDLAQHYESVSIYTARFSYIVERLNTIANSTLMLLSGLLMTALSGASLAAGKVFEVFRKPKQQ